MQGRVVALFLSMTTALAACGAASPSGASSSAHGAQAPAGGSATRAPTSCEVRATGSQGRVVRYQVKAQSQWWVTYGLVTNSCATEVRLQAVVAGDVPAGAFAGADLGAARVAPRPPSGSPPDLFVPAGPENPGRILRGYALPPGDSVQVLVKVALAPGTNRPQPVPPVSLSYGGSGGAAPGSVRLPIDLSFCACPLPAS